MTAVQLVRLIRGTFVAALSGAFATTIIHAGAIEKKYGADADAIAGKMKLNLMSMGHGSPKGTGPVAYLPALGGLPKRVALVSFYVWDSGNETHSVYNTTIQWSVTKSVTGSGREHSANALYEAAIGPMKNAFAAQGVQLLTPSEFLDTPEKKAAYESFTPEHGGVGAVMGFLTKKNRSEPAAADGYRVLLLPSNNNPKNNKFEMAAQGGDGKLFQGLGHDLATALGVDAVLIVYNPLQAQSRTIELKGTYAYMFGPNPVPKGDSTLYWTGHQYTGVYLPMDITLLEVDRKGTEVSNSFGDYGAVAKALAIKTTQYLKERIAEK